MKIWSVALVLLTSATDTLLITGGVVSPGSLVANV